MLLKGLMEPTGHFLLLLMNLSMRAIFMSPDEKVPLVKKVSKESVALVSIDCAGMAT